jgi:DNA polymerase I-like protein with 3'-5' exonuclease and polymerase domains
LIQGGAGQIMKHTMLKLRNDASFYVKMVNQVHDSLWIYLPTDQRDKMSKEIIEIMEWPTADLKFPFPVEAKQLDKDRITVND